VHVWYNGALLPRSTRVSGQVLPLHETRTGHKTRPANHNSLTRGQRNCRPPECTECRADPKSWELQNGLVAMHSSSVSAWRGVAGDGGRVGVGGAFLESVRCAAWFNAQRGLKEGPFSRPLCHVPESCSSSCCWLLVPGASARRRGRSWRRQQVISSAPAPVAPAASSQQPAASTDQHLDAETETSETERRAGSTPRTTAPVAPAPHQTPDTRHRHQTPATSHQPPATRPRGPQMVDGRSWIPRATRHAVAVAGDIYRL
jgi:hypothetical protein